MHFKNQNIVIMFHKTFIIFIFGLISFQCLSQVYDTIDVTDNEKIIITSNKRTEGNINVNFILFDAQYLSETFCGTIEYWSFFEDIQLNYNVVRIVQKNRSKYNDTIYINYLLDKLSKVIDSKKGFNVLVSHSAGSFFSFNLLNRKLPIDGCIFASPALNDYSIKNVNLSGVKKVYVSSSKKDSFGHDKYFKTISKKFSNVKSKEMKFELFKDLSHITLFQPSVYNGLSHLFSAFIDFEVDYGSMEFLPQNFNKIVSNIYNTNNLVISDDQYFFHYLNACNGYKLDQQLAYIEEYLKINPQSINFLFAKGDIFYEKKMYQEALEIYEHGFEECKIQKAWNVSDFEANAIKAKRKLK